MKTRSIAEMAANDVLKHQDRYKNGKYTDACKTTATINGVTYSGDTKEEMAVIKKAASFTKDKTKSVKTALSKVDDIFEFGNLEDVLALQKHVGEKLKTSGEKFLQEAIRSNEEELAKLDAERRTIQAKLTQLRTKGVESFGVDGSAAKPSHSRKSRLPKREEVMELIGNGVITTKKLALHFQVTPSTFRTYAKTLKVPKSGERDALVYLTDQQDNFQTLNGTKEITKQAEQTINEKVDN